MKINTNRKNRLLSILFVSITAFLLILPLWLNRAMIVGSDMIFHFNRFYDAAMQIKNGNLQYFVSLYAFQSTGRIVNALYGPLMAYVQGLIVLISPSWFGYQLISNFILFFISGMSFFCLLKKIKIEIKFAIPISIIYMTTFSILYWTFRQGFSSWGASLIPICLFPLVDLVNEQKLNPLLTAICVGLMFQVHMMSAALLVLVYICVFLITFFKVTNKSKINLLKQLLKAILLFMLLISNIIYNYISIFSKNNIAHPFINTDIAQQSIFKSSRYWLYFPPFLLLIIGFVIFFYFKNLNKLSNLFKTLFLTSAILFLLSTDLFPWQQLLNHHNTFAETIQFPFRFFIPFTSLILLLFAIALEHENHNFYISKWLMYLISLFAVLFACFKITIGTSQWKQSKDYLYSPINTYFMSKNTVKTKKSFFIKDKSRTLQYIVKSTPDYLPVNTVKNKNKYILYKKLIIDQQPKFEKEVTNKHLVVKWNANQEKIINVPVVKYFNTVIKINGQKLKTNSKVSPIGTPFVKQQKGKNKLMLYYQTDKVLPIVLIINIISWFICLGIYIKKAY